MFSSSSFSTNSFSTNSFDFGAVIEPPVEPPVVTLTKEATTGGGTVKSNRPILQLYQPLHENQFRANIVAEEDDEILSIVSLLIGAGIIK